MSGKINIYFNKYILYQSLLYELHCSRVPKVTNELSHYELIHCKDAKRGQETHKIAKKTDTE